MGEYLDLPAKVSPSLREEKGHAGITLDNYQILPPSSNHIYSYGYKPMRSVIAYLVIIFGFMGLYLLNAHFIAPHLTWDEAFVLSVSSFHGRGFFTQNVTLGDTYARLAAIEAVVGLFIEISFIATFTQRFLGK